MELTSPKNKQATSSDFFITGSIDGFVKFWKKQPIGIEFVKMYRSHLGPVDGEWIPEVQYAMEADSVGFCWNTGLAVSWDGTLCVSWSRDRTAKVWS